MGTSLLALAKSIYYFQGNKTFAASFSSPLPPAANFHLGKQTE